MMVLYTNYSTRWIDINHVLSRVSSMHRSDYCINYLLVLALFAIIFLVEEGPLIFFKIQMFVAQHFEISHTAWKNRSYTSSQSNFIQRRQWANPCALILHIDGATDHSVYKVAVDQKQQQLHNLTYLFS